MCPQSPKEQEKDVWHNHVTGIQRNWWFAASCGPEHVLCKDIRVLLLLLSIPWHLVKCSLLAAKGGLKHDHPPRKQRWQIPLGVCSVCACLWYNKANTLTLNNVYPVIMSGSHVGMRCRSLSGSISSPCPLTRTCLQCAGTRHVGHWGRFRWPILALSWGPRLATGKVCL